MANLISEDERAARRREQVRAAKRRFYAKHRERILAERQAAKAAGDDTNRRSHLKTQYGITPEQYDAMLEQQSGLCAGCGQAPEVFHVDHDHASGVVRGLLCRGCNVTLGNVRESADTLLALAAYLLRSQDVLTLAEA